VNAREWSSLESLTADSGVRKDETDQRTINSWIRTSGALDAVIDFDATGETPQTRARLLTLCRHVLTGLAVPSKSRPGQ
jgi:hypothetical protein